MSVADLDTMVDLGTMADFDMMADLGTMADFDTMAELQILNIKDYESSILGI